MFSVHVAEFAQSAQKPHSELAARWGPGVVADHPKAEDPARMNLSRGLGASATWRHESAEGKAAEEGAPLHQLIMSFGHLLRADRVRPAEIANQVGPNSNT